MTPILVLLLSVISLSFSLDRQLCPRHLSLQILTLPPAPLLQITSKADLFGFAITLKASFWAIQDVRDPQGFYLGGVWIEGLSGIGKALARLSPEERDGKAHLGIMARLEESVAACLSPCPEDRPQISELVQLLQALAAAATTMSTCATAAVKPSRRRRCTDVVAPALPPPEPLPLDTPCRSVDEDRQAEPDSIPLSGSIPSCAPSYHLLPPTSQLGSCPSMNDGERVESAGTGSSSCAPSELLLLPTSQLGSCPSMNDGERAESAGTGSSSCASSEHLLPPMVLLGHSCAMSEREQAESAGPSSLCAPSPYLPVPMGLLDICCWAFGGVRRLEPAPMPLCAPPEFFLPGGLLDDD